jgi:hypothetical protein
VAKEKRRFLGSNQWFRGKSAKKDQKLPTIFKQNDQVLIVLYFCKKEYQTAKFLYHLIERTLKYNNEEEYRKFLFSNGKVFLKPKIVGRFVPLGFGASPDNSHRSYRYVMNNLYYKGIVIV